MSDGIKFITMCGECPELIYNPDTPGIGDCSLMKEQRYNRRAVCDQIWENQVRVLSRFQGKGKTFVAGVFADQRHINPKLAVEAALGGSVKWDKKKKMEKAPQPETSEKE
ncbi:MAG: hypothetical protein KAR20_03085 [Candidatus Heimdallarchaeota archaeon]|nr:hypothetical protein [Candidatus Heimdallarchaeota archaeon]